MANSKFHISDDGVARKCEATKKPCKFGGDDEHYSTIQEAQAAYEERQSSQTFNTLQKEKDSEIDKNKNVDDYYFDDDDNYSYADYQGYDFTVPAEEYGITFKVPDINEVYMETLDDGSEFYRFEQLHELFYEFDTDDVEEGYRLDMPLNTLQHYLSEDLVNDYVNSESGVGSFSFDDEINSENGDAPSTMRLLVHKGGFFIIDGNHRFAAAKVSEQQTFSGIVIMMSDDLEQMVKLPPVHFNRLVERHNNKAKN